MIIGTAGHIDHGKSALVTALTGRPMDRLAEEKRRGITIDLNFAPLRFDGLPATGIVDVPGHEDFVRTMVAGASGIDLVLLVVDAAQGPQPQTWEHLAIVEQLGIQRGIPVITKADLAEPEWLELVATELAGRLEQSPVAFEPAAIVSAVTGQGVAELSARLRSLVESFRRESTEDGFRMPVDRAFSIAGVGTVVTGTPWSGALRLGETVTIFPRGLTGRVRSLEAYGAPVETARPGDRTAVGIAGVERAAIRRGDVLVDGRLPWRATTALDADIELLPAAPPPPPRGGGRRQLRVRVHLGTAEVLARLYPRGELRPGGHGLARLALEEPILARGGDRFVLRSYSPVVTIGGGRVLDPLPPRRAEWPPQLAERDPARRAAALVTRRPDGIPADELPLLLGVAAKESQALIASSPEIVARGGHLVAAATVESLKQAAIARVMAFHSRSPGESGLSLETLRRALRGTPAVVTAVVEALIRAGALQLRNGLVALPGFTPQVVGGGEDLMVRILTLLDAAGLAPPTVSELEHRLEQPGLLPVLRRAATERRVIAVESDRFFSTTAVDRFTTVIRELAVAEAITPARLRDRLGISRKFLIPLLEWADRSGVTRRVGDGRVLV